jgi:hypothetical protein
MCRARAVALAIGLILVTGSLGWAEDPGPGGEGPGSGSGGSGGSSGTGGEESGPGGSPPAGGEPAEAASGGGEAASPDAESGDVESQGYRAMLAPGVWIQVVPRTRPHMPPRPFPSLSGGPAKCPPPNVPPC